ncbi:MAG TPA: L,D-transpeptidase family protein [Candidatus Binataceae bacterium]|nr:L,D-transpeptidase family protein [Candidatus Binataceae bacterium]
MAHTVINTCPSRDPYRLGRSCINLFFGGGRVPWAVVAALTTALWTFTGPMTSRASGDSTVPQAPAASGAAPAPSPGGGASSPSTTLPPPAADHGEFDVIINAGMLPDLRWPNFTDYRSYVKAFYETGGYALAWTAGGRPTPQAQGMIQQFKQAQLKGLNPEDYDASRWDGRLAKLAPSAPNPSQTDLIHFDLAMTVLAMRFASDLHIGRINPQHFKFALGAGPEKLDLPNFVRNRLLSTPDVAATITSIERPYGGYRRAEAALANYLKLATQGDGQPVPTPQKSLRPGQTFSGMPQLVSRLHQLGDLTSIDDPATQGVVYQGVVVDAVKHFQTRHGMEPDGVLGKSTIAEINRPLSERVIQLQLALERYRWLPLDFPQPPILVNIPEFRLRTLRRAEGGFLTMNVVVGKAYRHKTPVFADEMRYVIFHPYWNVPPSIANAELFPKGSTYLASHGFEVVDGQIRQRPGPRNALGPVKFVFPNSYNVYLHGTPAVTLFSRARRDFSHGCIRVEDPAALAAWVLRDKPGWTPDRIRAVIKGSETIQVNLDKPIPVLILYSTAVVEPDGEVRFFDDIYGYDYELEKALAAGYPYSS